MKNLNSLYLVLLISVSSFTTYSACLNVKGTVKFENSFIEGAKVTILRDGHADTTITTNQKGRFDINLKGNNEYNCIISKDGFLSQNVLFNTQLDNPDDYTWVYKFTTNLLPKLLNKTESDILEPIALITYNTETDEFENTIYVDNRIGFNDLIKQYEVWSHKDYKQTIAAADSAFVKYDYKLALELYNKAAILDESNIYADNQIYNIKRILAKDLRLENRYDKALRIADKYFANKEMLKAKKYYLKAYKLKQAEYPKQQISKIKTTISLRKV